MAQNQNMNELTLIRGGDEPARQKTVLDVLNEFDRQDAIENAHKPRTREKYRNMNDNFRRYLEQTEQADLPITEISVPLLKYFTLWLPENLRSCDRTHISKHIYRFNRAFDYAVCMGYTSYNPCASYKVKRAKTKPVVNLEDAEFNLWVSAVWHSEIYRKVQKLFSFQMVTGIAYGDLFDYKTIKDSQGLWIEGARSKTGMPFYVPLWHPDFALALEIHNEFGGKLPRLENHYYNRILCEMAGILGIKKRITSHIGRKTFATVKDENGYSTPCIAAFLGNTEKVCRMHYINPSKKKIVAELARRAG